ncbi:MAG: cobalt-zinc-cadmium efflux system outer membrane protein [Myxococcota bacterium]|jgi:cobalt-zinc-cadmium efflux system outer membrane protein
MWSLILCAALAAPVDPGAAVRASLESAPLVAAAEARLVTAQGARQHATGPQHNPELQVGASLDGNRLQGQLLQPLSLTGEGLQDRRSARADVEAAEAGLARARLQTAATTRLAYARLSRAAAALSVADKQLRGASRLREAAQLRLDAGDAPELDAQLARLEEARVVASWLDARKETVAARSHLVALTGLPRDLEVADDPLEAAAGLAGVRGDGARSDVTAAEADVSAARASLASERAAILPPVGLGAFYESDAGSVVAGPMVVLQLPIWNQNQGHLAAARAGLMVAEAELDATRGRADVQAASLGGSLEAVAHAEGLLAASVAADAASALAAVEQAYALGEADLNTALQLQARIIAGELGWYAARASMAETRIDVALAAEDGALVGPP